MANCVDCKHLRRESECPIEFPHIWWWECRKRPNMANLRSFPFHNTNCTAFDAKALRKDEGQ